MRHRQLTLSPYFHPTSVVLVDDNEAFLQSLTLEMPTNIAFHGFTSPEAALDFLNEPIALEPLVDRCFSIDRRDGEAFIHLDFGVIEREINHLERFRRVSVVLVDYAMPSVDGLQFCERLRDPYARRAMLTGVADEKLAVEAFNAGLIHRFIPKQKASSVEALIAFVAELERDYFQQYVARLRTTLSMDPPGFLVDPVIAVQVHRLMQEERVAEYYLVTDPPGFLMLRADGTVLRLLLLDPDAHARQIDFVRRFDAPTDLRQGIERGELAGMFSDDSPADYFGDESYPWHECVVPAQRIEGQQSWLVALVRDAAADVDFDPARSSYDAYLAGLTSAR
ncbi:MAG: response regulator [Pseudomonadales bacterium]